jgi:hypothetical protein
VYDCSTVTHCSVINLRYVKVEFNSARFVGMKSVQSDVGIYKFCPKLLVQLEIHYSKVITDEVSGQFWNFLFI